MAALPAARRRARASASAVQEQARASGNGRSSSSSSSRPGKDSTLDGGGLGPSIFFFFGRRHRCAERGKKNEFGSNDTTRDIINSGGYQVFTARGDPLTSCRSASSFPDNFTHRSGSRFGWLTGGGRTRVAEADLAPVGGRSTRMTSKLSGSLMKGTTFQHHLTTSLTIVHVPQLRHPSSRCCNHRLPG